MSTFIAIDKEEEAITAASAIQQLSISESKIAVPSANEISSSNDSTTPNTAISPSVAPAAAPAAAVVPAVEEVKIKIIDWDEAMSSIGGSEEFLQEVVQDLLKEASTAEEDIGKGMKDADLTAIMKAAHRIGGSASYFSCEDLVGRASEIKHVAAEALKAKETAAAAAAAADPASPNASSNASPNAASPGPAAKADPAMMAELTRLFAKFTTSANTLRAEVARRFAKEPTTVSSSSSTSTPVAPAGAGTGAGL